MSQEKPYNELANQYDHQVFEYDSHAPDILFGMSYGYVKEGETLLDIGIGTGLASIQFARTGLKVFGLDTSEDMLAVCRSKSFTEELHQYDFTQGPIPYDDSSFDHVICCGVTHFVGDLGTLFSEVKRVGKGTGIYAFTFAPNDTTNTFSEEPTAWGVSIHKHSPKYIADLMNKNGMELLKRQRVLAKDGDKIHYNMVFTVLVCRFI